MWAAHSFEDLGIYVLEGYVEVVEDFFAGGNGFNEPVADARGVEIKQTNPAQAGDFREFSEEIRQGVFDTEVSAVGGYILSDDVQLDGAGGDKFRCLGEDELLWLAAGNPSDGGDGAEGAVSAATLADSQVGIVRGGDSQANPVVTEGFAGRRQKVSGVVGEECFFDYVCDVVAVFEAEDSVDLGDLIE